MRNASLGKAGPLAPLERQIPPMRHFLLLPLLLSLLLAASCARVERRTMLATGYCRCGTCNDWERGSSKYLKLDFWNRYITAGPQKGERYTGRTASSTKLHAPRSGLLSVDSLRHPWMILVRTVLFWHAPRRPGTIAADTDYYPFGTRMKIEGWGEGVVQDRGGAIKGPDRIDLFFASHGKANRWGRRQVEVEIRPPTGR